MESCVKCEHLLSMWKGRPTPDFKCVILCCWWPCPCGCNIRGSFVAHRFIISGAFGEFDNRHWLNLGRIPSNVYAGTATSQQTRHVCLDPLTSRRITEVFNLIKIRGNSRRSIAGFEKFVCLCVCVAWIHRSKTSRIHWLLLYSHPRTLRISLGYSRLLLCWVRHFYAINLRNFLQVFGRWWHGASRGVSGLKGSYIHIVDEYVWNRLPHTYPLTHSAHTHEYFSSFYNNTFSCRSQHFAI